MTAGAERRTSSRAVNESRHRGRAAALQMLYQWEIGRLPMGEVQQSFWDHTHGSDVAVSAEVQTFAARLADGVAAGVEQLDPVIIEAAEHWRLERMNVLDRLILRVAVYELLHEPATPAKVVINEALELAHTFCGEESVRFINGVLDAIRRKLERA